MEDTRVFSGLRVRTVTMPNTNASTGEWTNVSLLLKYEEKLALDINLKEAVAYARAHQLGARKAITNSAEW